MILPPSPKSTTSQLLPGHSRLNKDRVRLNPICAFSLAPVRTVVAFNSTRSEFSTAHAQASQIPSVSLNPCSHLFSGCFSFASAVLDMSSFAPSISSLTSLNTHPSWWSPVIPFLFRLWSFCLPTRPHRFHVLLFCFLSLLFSFLLLSDWTYNPVSVTINWLCQKLICQAAQQDCSTTEKVSRWITTWFMND